MAFRKRAYRKRTNTTSRVKKTRSNNQVAKIAKSVVQKELKKTVEVKDDPYGQENLQLYHNVPKLVDSNGFFTSQGTTDPSGSSSNNRIGDSVFFKHLNCKLWLAQKSDRPNLMYRISLIYRRTNSGAILTGQPYVNRTGNGNYMLGDIDMEDAGVAAILYDKVFTFNDGHDLSSGGTVKEAHHLIKIFKRLNHKCVYYGDSGTIPRKFTPQLWITPYDSYGTLTTDNVASCGFQRNIKFTDM